MRIWRGLAAGLVLAGVAAAQGTKLWTVSRYDEMELGTADGVAIRSDGRLEAGPASSLLFQTGGNYVWSVAADAQGNAFVGMGGTAAGGAVVMRVAGSGEGSGKATKVFEGRELGVQAVRVGADGKVYVATLPEGKVYRLGATPAEAAVVFDPAGTEEKPKYLWALTPGKAGEVYVATGAPAAVYRLPAGGGKAEVVFRSVDQHVRCLLLGPDGMLWIGTDGGGVIYRLDTKKAGAKPFAVYTAAKREITALAMDSAGNVYAAGVGAKPSPTAGPSAGLPPLPVTGAMGVTVTFSQPGSASAATANTLIPEGSEIYRIAATDGSAARLVALKEDVVYALAVDDGALLAATGNRGRVYRVDIGSGGQMPEMPGRYTDVAHLEAAQGTAFAPITGGQIVGTSNSGKVFRLMDRPAPASTYTSEVFDAQGFAQWGRLETRPEGTTTTAAGAFELFARSGNVESPLMGWSEWTPVAKSGLVTLPGGRFAQWKAVLHEGARVESVGVNYLQKNIAPVVDDIAVQPGARVNAGAVPPANTMVPVSFAGPGGSGGVNLQSFVPDANAAPLLATKDKTAVTVRWAAHDDNGDELLFSVWYRGEGETNWRLLKEKVTERYLSFDSALLPDGQYAMRVVASDAPAHPEAEALTGERVSAVFVVDTTPPVPGPLVAAMVPAAAGAAAKIHATFSAKDATSPIARAEYSVDAGPWQYLEPVGKVSDAMEERYDFVATVPSASGTGQGGGAAATGAAREHVIAVRVYDRMENVVAVKAVVR